MTNLERSALECVRFGCAWLVDERGHMAAISVRDYCEMTADQIGDQKFCLTVEAASAESARRRAQS